MSKPRPPTILLVVFVFLITLGLAISLQSVFGLNIAGSLTGPLNLGNHKITGIAAPNAPGEAATWDFVNTVAGTLQKRVSGTCPAGKVILIINADGSVTCS